MTAVDDPLWRRVFPDAVVMMHNQYPPDWSAACVREGCPGFRRAGLSGWPEARRRYRMHVDSGVCPVPVGGQFRLFDLAEVA